MVKSGYFKYLDYLDKKDVLGYYKHSGTGRLIKSIGYLYINCTTTSINCGHVLIVLCQEPDTWKVFSEQPSEYLRVLRHQQPRWQQQHR